jgi:error-prone DNA polymerase
MNYCELHSCSAFSFLRGGSFPEQLAEVAAELEVSSIALCDRNGVYGAQRFSVAAREHGVRPIVGTELSIQGGGILPVLVENRSGYKNLCELLTQAHLRSEKGKCEIKWDELPQFAEGLVALFNSSLIPAAETAAAIEERAIEGNRPYLILPANHANERESMGLVQVS